MAETAEEYLARQATEWGTYVAIAPIYVDGVRACQPGDSVPVSNVDRYGYLAAGLVALRNTTQQQAAPAATQEG